MKDDIGILLFAISSLQFWRYPKNGNIVQNKSCIVDNERVVYMYLL